MARCDDDDVGPANLAGEVASAITPVPGGIGPLTNALLLAHLMRAAQRQVVERRATGASS